MIRNATKRDVNKINELGINLIPNFLKTYDIEKYIEDKNYTILVNEDNEVNAFLLIFNGIDTYDILIIYVKEEYRNLGIASLLIEYFLNNIYDKIKDIFLEVAVNNKNAIKLYQKYDFVVINTRKKYYKDIDAYIMKRVEK